MQSLSAISSTDASAGFTWSLADWYLEDEAARVASTPWYDCTDISTLYQDTAGTTAVTAVNDPVRLIKAQNGNTDHDLLILTTGTPGTYKTRGGVGYVEHGTGVSFVTRADISLVIPMFIAVGCVHRTALLRSMFGITNASTMYFHIFNPSTGQNRAQIRTLGTGLSTGTALTSTESNFRDAPVDAPLCAHALFDIGSQDIEVNNLGAVSEAVGLDGTESDTACKLGTALNGKSSSSSSDTFDFYGGWFHPDDPGSELRSNVAAYIQKKGVKPQLGTDRNILVVGDSTGDETNETAGGVFVTNGEWVYQWAEQFAADNATAYVEIQTFASLLEYRPPIVVQDGSGDVIRIWNASIAGSQPNEALGANFAKMIQDVPTCDTAAINHGYNPVTAGAPVATWAAQQYALIEAIKVEHPGAHVFLVRQPRTEVGTTMDSWVAAVDDVATLYGADKFDVWQRYQDYGGTFGDLFADGLHPSEAGVDEWIAQINSDYAAALPIETQGAGFTDTQADNLLSNGRFDSWSSGVPTGWTKSGGGTLSEVVGDNEFYRPAAAQIEDTSGTQTYIETSIDPSSVGGSDVRGELLTLSVRIYIDAAPDGTYLSRIHVASDGTGAPTNYVVVPTKWYGGWQWLHSQITVPADATEVTARVYGRYSGGGAITVKLSSAVLTLGDEPRARLIDPVLGSNCFLYAQDRIRRFFEIDESQ